VGYTVVMPLMDRLKRFLASPQGKRVADQARRAASDPKNQQKARDLLTRLRGGRRR
jgi:hypothetical protein